MYRLKPKDFVKGRFIALWSLLSFQAGFINSIGFLACHRFVSHVTGFSSQVGITIGTGKYVLALEMLSAPFAFVLGAWVNGVLTVARHSRGLTARYDLVTLSLMVLALIGFVLQANANSMKEFNECVNKCVEKNTKDRKDIASLTSLYGY